MYTYMYILNSVQRNYFPENVCLMNETKLITWKFCDGFSLVKHNRSINHVSFFSRIEGRGAFGSKSRVTNRLINYVMHTKSDILDDTELFVSSEGPD